MSRDSSITYIHLRSSRFADLFEEFCRPPSATFPPTGNTQQNGQSAANLQGGTSNGDGSGMVQLPGHFLPFEEIPLPPHLMPVNPEDEDDVVPDMHAAFGINRALNQNTAAGAGATGHGVAGGVGGSGGVAGTGEPGGESSHAGVQREPIWRDLGLQRLMAEVDAGHNGEATGTRREGKRVGALLLR